MKTLLLKRLEAYGFKSFADKVNIEFQPGITGIVGPNGCGKSNISDAVRWVLGEQSVKSLRGSNMADVIFAGSQDRRAQNLAEVTLIFDNSDRMLNYDYNEVRSMMTWHLHQAKEHHLPAGQEKVRRAAATGRRRDLHRTVNFFTRLV